MKNSLRPISIALAVFLLSVALGRSALAADNAYLINPGDVMQLFVWNEADLTREVRVRPDGAISVPIVGDVPVGGHSVADAEQMIVEALSSILKDAPRVTLSLVNGEGNKVSVLGKVNRPGEFLMLGRTDITQALAMAGGLNTFAAENSIVVLRRDASGEQTAIRFRYADIKDGEDLHTNIILKSGDVVVVP
jgi:polysaccharide export outer membrane protein